MSKPLVSDALWEIIRPLLPPEPPKPKGGRPRVPDRAALTGIIFVLLNRWVRLETQGRFRGRLAGCLAGLGVMSYSLYLTHVPLLRLLVSLIPAPGLASSVMFVHDSPALSER